ncbi:MAG: hypothetical protein Ct9H300mP18_11730 [Candidatus Neomarinimicrobiota bacterium]|nr:MAG: hypothetical protein Ct9H300mP18_11730 [Candidatus Neomarinimicrobiota bacterium]
MFRRKNSNFLSKFLVGDTQFKALAVATKNGGKPCGACRQVIWDLCGNISVYITDNLEI